MVKVEPGVFFYSVDTESGVSRVRARHGVAATYYACTSSVARRITLPDTAHRLHCYAVHHAADEPGFKSVGWRRVGQHGNDADARDVRLHHPHRTFRSVAVLGNVKHSANHPARPGNWLVWTASR